MNVFSLQHFKKAYPWVASLSLIGITIISLQMWWYSDGYEITLWWQGKLDCASFIECFNQLPDGHDSVFALIIGNLIFQCLLYTLFWIADRLYGLLKKSGRA